jgi:hypothetical protein
MFHISSLHVDAENKIDWWFHIGVLHVHHGTGMMTGKHDNAMMV